MSTAAARSGSAPLWAVLAACAALLFWTANGVRIFSDDRTDAWHHYEYLVDGFLAGHTSLSVLPAPGLLALADPYDPAQNGAYRLWDASLYHGKFFLYFGPTPTLLMLPWRAATGHHLPQRLAVAAFAVGGLAALALLLSEVRRRHFPGVSPLAAGGILVVAMCASWLPVTLRRPDVWELALVAACACLWWAIYFLWRCLGSETGTRWAIGVGAAIALMLGSRPTSFFGGAAIILLLLGAGRMAGRRFALAAAAATAGGLALLAYNVARFGSPLEFGQSYQLWGGDERGIVHFSLRYLPYNAWLYLLSLPDLSPYFPFVLAVPPGGEPSGYVGIDEMHGALVAVPVQLASLAAVAWAWANRRDPASAPLRRTIFAAVLASVFAAFILFCYAGAASRYTTELLAGATVATSIGLMAILNGSTAPKAGNVLRLLALCAGAWTVGYVALASAENRILMRKTEPAAYDFAAHLLDYPSAWIARGQEVRYGPVALAIRVPPGKGNSETVLVSSGRQGMAEQLILEQREPGLARLVLAENYLSPIVRTPFMHVEGGLLIARVDAPWLYPPRQSPWWDAIANPAVRHELQTRFALTAGDRVTEQRVPRSFDPTRFQPWVASKATAAPGEPWVDSLGYLPAKDR